MEERTQTIEQPPIAHYKHQTEVSLAPEAEGRTFLTKSELAQHCGVSEKKISYRFNQLRESHSLRPGVDYYTKNFRNWNRFEWMIEPVHFLEAAKDIKEDAQHHSLGSGVLGFKDDGPVDPPAPIEHPEPGPDRVQAEEIVDAKESSSEAPDDRVLGALLNQLEKKDEQIAQKDKQLVDQQETVNLLLTTANELATENKLYRKQIFELEAPKEKEHGQGE